MKTEIVCIIDRSGSMQKIANDAIGGFNVFLAEQQSLPGEANLTLVLFDDQYEVLHNRVNIQEVPLLDSTTYYARGFTALYDAIGKSINTLGDELSKESDSDNKVIVVILTDGAENHSREFNRSQVAEMIKHQTEKYSWEFIFLGANQDAFEVGASLNINASNTANYVASAEGTRSVMRKMSDYTTSYRSN